MAATACIARRRRWKKGTWMKLRSRELLRALVGDPAKRPEVKMSARTLARRVINPDTGKPIHPSFIDHLLNGRASSCTPRIAEQIAEALEMPLNTLFDPQIPSGAQQVAKAHAHRTLDPVA